MRWAASHHTASIRVAQDSFSQACDQSSQVTRSPNHWWASSWATSASGSCSRTAFSSTRIRSVIVVQATFSMPPNTNSWTTT